MPFKVYFEQSCSSGLRDIFREGDGIYFGIVSEARDADIIVFQRDDWKYVKSHGLFKEFASRCIAITECDRPSFFLPTICASNSTFWLAKSRAETMEYMLAHRANWNPYISAQPADRIKCHLYSFVGKPSSKVRRHLLAAHGRSSPGDVLVENSAPALIDTVRYSLESQRRYAEIMAASKFAICPRGWGTGGVRLFEACCLGVAPVILADAWYPISGMSWNFAIFVREKDVSKLDAIVRSREHEWRERGAAARRAYETEFAHHVNAGRLHFKISRLLATSRPAVERAVRASYPLVRLGSLAQDRFRKIFLSYRP
jgi:Exostosin family